MKLIIICFIIILFFSCNLITNFSDYDFPDWNDTDELEDIIKDNIIQNYDINTHNKIDYWQHPAITWKNKTGDCEDVVILWMDQIYKKYNYKCYLINAYNSSKEKHHAIGYCEELNIYFNNFYPYNLDNSETKIIYKTNYDYLIYFMYFYNEIL